MPPTLYEDVSRICGSRTRSTVAPTVGASEIAVTERSETFVELLFRLVRPQSSPMLLILSQLFSPCLFKELQSLLDPAALKSYHVLYQQLCSLHVKFQSPPQVVQLVGES